MVQTIALTAIEDLTTIAETLQQIELTLLATTADQREVTHQVAHHDQ